MATRRMTNRSTIRSEMIRGATTAFWIPAWANAEEERGRSFAGMRLEDVAPPPPLSAKRLATRFVHLMEVLSGKYSDQIWTEASQADGKRADPYDLGFYLAMQGLGHGISWTDSHEFFSVNIPSSEAYAFRNRGRFILDGSVSDRFTLAQELS